MKGAADCLNRCRRFAYNLSRKPWRTAKHCRRSMKMRGHKLKYGLFLMIFAEITILRAREPELFAWTREEVFHMERGEETLSETDLTGTNSSLEKTDSGVTVDLKKGRIEFWKTDASIRPEDDG